MTNLFYCGVSLITEWLILILSENEVQILNRKFSSNLLEIVLLSIFLTSELMNIEVTHHCAVISDEIILLVTLKLNFIITRKFCRNISLSLVKLYSLQKERVEYYVYVHLLVTNKTHYWAKTYMEMCAQRICALGNIHNSAYIIDLNEGMRENPCQLKSHPFWLWGYDPIVVLLVF